MKPDKRIEEFTKYLITEANSEGPSSDFVEKVMDTIKAEYSIATVKKDKPLISKWGWIFISLLIVSGCTYVFTGNFENPSFLSGIDFDVASKISSLNIFEGIKLSKMFTMSFILFSMLVVFQLVVIKNYFNKQNAL